MGLGPPELVPPLPEPELDPTEPELEAPPEVLKPPVGEPLPPHAGASDAAPTENRPRTNADAAEYLFIATALQPAAFAVAVP